MTHDGYDVDADRLAARASQFEPLTAHAEGLHRGLTEALSADGACWGTDAVGRSFAAVHAGPADDLLTRLSALPDRLGSVAARLSGTARTYDAGEQDALDHLTGTER